MSIELDAPNIMTPGGVVREALVSPGHVCNCCHGTGKVTREAEDSREWEYKECPVCKGNGELDAVITVEWKPSGKNLLRNILKEQRQ